MRANTIEVIDNGLHCLSENLGPAETERFIVALLRERFDYTVWRRRVVDRIESFDDLDKLLNDTAKSCKFNGNAEVV